MPFSTAFCAISSFASATLANSGLAASLSEAMRSRIVSTSSLVVSFNSLNFNLALRCHNRSVSLSILYCFAIMSPPTSVASLLTFKTRLVSASIIS